MDRRSHLGIRLRVLRPGLDRTTACVLELQCIEAHDAFARAGIETQGVEDFGFVEVKREVAPLAVVRDVEGLVPAFGQRDFHVGGPVDFAIATSAALKAKRERVGAGGFDIRRIKR